MSEKGFEVKLVLDVTVQEAESDRHYRGEINGLQIPFKFEISFGIPTDSLETYVKMGEVFGVPEQEIVDAIRQALMGRCDLRITTNDIKLISPAIEEQLKEILFGTITMAIGLLQGKPGVSEATFRVPCFSAEELGQFRNSKELQEYVLSLN